MTVVRRLYLYALAFVTLGALAVGAALVIDQLLGALGGASSGAVDRPLASTGLALAAVGGAAWTGHWLAIRRTLDDPRERASATRALYFSTARVISVVVVLASLSAVIGQIVAARPGETPLASDSARALAAIALVSALIWVRATATGLGDGARVRRRRPAEALNRTALYVGIVAASWTLATGLVSLLQGIVLELNWRSLQPALPGLAPWYTAGAGPTIAGVVVLLPQLAHAVSLVGPRAPTAAREAAAHARRAAWAVIALIAWSGVVGGAVSATAASLGSSEASALPSLFGSDVAFQLGLAAVIAYAAFGGAAWRLQRREDALAADDPGRAGRTWTYALAAVGVFQAGLGVGEAVDLLLSRAAGVGPSQSLSSGLAAAASNLLPGLACLLAVAIFAWRRSRTDPFGEVVSTARRSVLAGSAAAGALTALVGTTSVLQRILDAVLGSPNFLRLGDLSTATAWAVTGAVVAALAAWTWMRDDASLKRSPDERDAGTAAATSRSSGFAAWLRRARAGRVRRLRRPRRGPQPATAVPAEAGRTDGAASGEPEPPVEPAITEAVPEPVAGAPGPVADVIPVEHATPERGALTRWLRRAGAAGRGRLARAHAPDSAGSLTSATTAAVPADAPDVAPPEPPGDPATDPATEPMRDPVAVADPGGPAAHAAPGDRRRAAVEPAEGEGHAPE